jgi:hypothetical protein
VLSFYQSHVLLVNNTRILSSSFSKQRPAYTSTMLSLIPTISICLVFTLLWTCQSSQPRTRRRANVQGKNTSTKTRGEEIKMVASEKKLRRELSEKETTCAAISVVGFPSCAEFCEQETGYSLNTFMELDHGPNGKQLCCACFSGDAYCSDDIPECVDYVNLDFSGLSIKWYNSGEAEESDIVNVSMNVSCVEANVTNSLACLDFCEEATGNATSEYRSNTVQDKFFCVCSSSLVAGGNTTYCSDNMSDRWKEALSNSTVLPLSTRMGIMP